MQSLSKRLLSISLPPTSLHTSAVCLGIRDKFVSHKDLNKRPSEVEIRKKDLPAKTPTLGERIQRDRVWVFHVSDPKSGYFKGKTGTVRDAFEGKTTKDIVLEGFRDLKNEVGKWAHEVKDDIRTGGPHNKLVQIGDRRTEWKFDTEEDLDQWIYTCDSDWGEGYSTCAVVPSPTGHALFTGELSTRVPQDGRTQKAGYCNMSSVKRRRSFHRLVEFEHWLDYTHLTLRVRGDGRSYVVNIHCHGELDLSWNDLWQFPLYTRGGPYWQETRTNGDVEVVDLETPSSNGHAAEDEECMYDPSLLEAIDFSSSGVSFNPPLSPSKPGPGLKVRPLMTGDYDRGFLQLLSQLTKVGNISREDFLKQFHSMKSTGDYYVTVIIDTALDKVIGAATLAVERKFIHQCATRGMLEDVVVSDEYRGRQLGKLIVVTITELARHVGCYKSTLSCQDKMVKFYSGLTYKLEQGNGNYMMVRF